MSQNRSFRFTRGCRWASLVLAWLLAVALAPHPARAQEPPPEDKAAGQQLFLEGKKLLDEGKVDEACLKFAASHKVMPSVGALLNLALCHEKQVKTASAWAEYTEAANLARRTGQPEREEVARKYADQLLPQLSKLTIEVVQKVAGLTVDRDGVPIVEGSLGTAIPVDPGAHTITAKAPKHKDWTATVNIGTNGDSKTVQIPPLEPVAPEDTGNGEPVGGDGEGGGLSTLSIAGYSVLGVGVLAVGIGVVFGIIAANDVSAAEGDPDLCPDKVCTSQAGNDKIEDARAKATVSTIGIAVGAAAVAGGLLMVLLAPDGEPEPEAAGVVRLAPLIGPGLGGLALAGRF